MDVSVLGPVNVAGGTRPIAPSSRPAMMLAVLLSPPNRARSSDVLIDQIWSTPPRTVDASMRVHLSALRAALRPADHAPSRLGRTAAGYVVTVEPDELDADRFVGKVTAAMTSRATDPAMTTRLLEEALELWRGTPFDGIDDVELVDVKRRELLDIRRVAVETLSAALLENGDHAAVTTRSVAWRHEFPTSEQLASHVVLAQYRDGEQIAALRTWRDFVRHLDDEYGVAPTASFRSLEHDLLAQSPSIAGIAPPHHRIGRVHGPTGRWRIRERRAELEMITDALDDDAGPAVISVSGPSGLGKTTLLGELHRVHHAPMVSCRTSTGSLHVIDELYDQLGASRRRDPHDDGILHGRIAAELLGLLGPQRQAILVDDIDHCDQDSAEVFRILLRARAGPFVTTSRRRGARSHPLLEDVSWLSRSLIVELRPLSSEAVGELVRRSVPDASRSQLDWFQRATGGNPLLVESLCRVGADGADDRVPAAAVEYVRRIVADIGAGATGWMTTAAVDSSDTIDVDLVNRATRTSGRSSTRILEGAFAMGLVHQQGGQFRFRYRLGPEALVDHLSAPRRRELHEDLARGILDAPTDARDRRLGPHLRAGQPADELAPLAAAVTARDAERALAAGGVLAAADLLTTAIDLATRTGLPFVQRSAWGLMWCDAMIAAGRITAAQERATAIAREARSHNDREVLVGCAIRAVGPVIPTGHRQEDAEVLVNEALEWSADSHAPIAVALAEAASRAVISRTGPTAISIRRRIMPALAGVSDHEADPTDRALACLGMRSLSWARPEHATRRLEHARAAVAASRRSSDHWLQLRARRALTSDLFATANPDLREAIDTYLRSAVDQGSPFHQWCAARMDVAWQRARGDDRAADRAALVARQVEAAVDPDTAIAAFVAEQFAVRMPDHRLGDLHGASAGVDDTHLAPSVALAVSAVAASHGEGVELAGLAEALSKAPGGPLRGAAAAFAVLAATWHWQSSGEVAHPLVEQCVADLLPLAGGVILIEGGIACLGPTDAYLEACFVLADQPDRAEHHRQDARSVAIRFAPRWTGWSVRRPE